MKKLLSAFFLLSVLALSAYSQNKIFAKVEAVSGKVEIYKGSAWSSLTEGALLNRGDIISTGFNSEAVILIKDSRVKLAALTRMTVEQLAENDVKEETRLFIDTGKVSASVKHAENKRTDFKVRSPVSTASVRGTEFDFFAIGKIATTLGLVSASASSSPVAQVAQSDDVSGGADAEGESSVMTNVADVGDAYGTPVYEGQETVKDNVSGNFIPTQLTMISSTQDVGGFSANTGNSISENGTAALSGMTSGPASSASAGAADSSNPSSEPAPAPTPAPTSASLSITLTLN